ECPFYREKVITCLSSKPNLMRLNALVVRKFPEVYQRLRVQLCSKDPEGYREFAKILMLNVFVYSMTHYLPFTFLPSQGVFTASINMSPNVTTLSRLGTNLISSFF
ncbi:hypothetical protein HMPREF0322_03023, partial [Desulfitobacterium hafniense DP7]